MGACVVALIVLCGVALAGDASGGGEARATPRKPGIWVDTYYENASPLRWELPNDTTLDILPLCDHERFSLNRQLTHWNFKIRCTPELVGSVVTVTLADATNIWNGKPASAFRGYKLAAAVCSDGAHWSCTAIEQLAEGPAVLRFQVKLESTCVQVARLVPYTDSDLQAALKRIRTHPDVRVYNIGETAEGRPLEIVELGAAAAPNQVFLRARAHPWESGGSWLLNGLMQYLISDDAEAAQIRRQVCFCLMPMANKDGVCRGLTRFNVNGCDLNRKWFAAEPQDPKLAPENACLQRWFDERQRQGRLPKLAICIHNDNSGGLHLSHPRKDPEAYVARMGSLEKLLRERTFCHEGAKGKGQGFTNSGSFGEGVTEMYGIDGLVWELREGWADGLGRPPLHSDWQKLGAEFAKIVRDFFVRSP
ncbi:MAG: M14 family zinc carboxypeptidase [Planctomycetota bacterium]